MVSRLKSINQEKIKVTLLPSAWLHIGLTHASHFGRLTLSFWTTLDRRGVLAI